MWICQGSREIIPVPRRVKVQAGLQQEYRNSISLLSNQILHRDVPWIAAVHPVSFAVVHEWYKNYYPQPLAFNAVKYVRLDPELRAQRRREWNRPRWVPIVVLIVLLAVATIPAIRVAARHFREG